MNLFIKPNVHNIEGLIMEAFKDCKNKCFNLFNKWCYKYNIKFVNGIKIKNDNYTVSFDDGSKKIRSGRFNRITLGDIKKLASKIFANVSDLKIYFYLKITLPSSLEKLFYKNLSNNCEYINK